MPSRTKIKQLIKESKIGEEVQVAGWIRSKREQKTFSFIELNDGSTLANFQLVVQSELPGYSGLISQLTTGAAIRATGKLVESPGGKQQVEMQVENIELIGSCPADEYPLQKKRHSFEFLRTIAHLRPRTNTQGAVARVRNALAFATHSFFQEHGFLYLQSPIITSSDCEGAGEMFQVSSLDLQAPPKKEDGSIDFSKDFFGKPAFLTVSGQLNGEAYATALSDIYTFGPTFRAENSHTARHLAEFWMIEPEMAFADLADTAKIGEEYLKYLVKYAKENCEEDLNFFDKWVEKGLHKRLDHILDTPFAHIPYTEAVEILQKSNEKFDFEPKWGIDLQTEHERYLTEKHAKKPVIVTDYPKEIKAFYMRENDDHKTVAALDILVPKVGEIIGGSQREERFDLLEAKFKAHDLDIEHYKWYLDLRRYGSVPHSGFGAGFERLVQFVTGMENIRDVIAFPRVPGQVEF
ncbi:MAG: asparagine--tRNA ligase [Candidatus Algichlamydia australiensis]|nr:asparagine--tRNA ligase [Chlamydiales bacterium]